MEIILPLEILNNMPWVWLGIAVIMTIIEGLTMGLTTIWLAIAALVSMILAFIIPSFTIQVIIFLILSIVLFVFTRPVAVNKLKLGKVKTNSDRLVGMTGVVKIPVSMDSPGQVTVGGQIWTSRPEDADLSFQEGEHIQVVRIEGVTLIIGKIPSA